MSLVIVRGFREQKYIKHYELLRLIKWHSFRIEDLLVIADAQKTVEFNKRCLALLHVFYSLALPMLSILVCHDLNNSIINVE